MDYCAICGCDISELGSNRCLGFACERRLCFQCFSDTGGYCPRCKVQDDIDSVVGGSSRADVDQLYDEMAEAEADQEKLRAKVRSRREMEKEEQNSREEEKQEVSEEDETTEEFILRRLRELNKEMEEE